MRTIHLAWLVALLAMGGAPALATSFSLSGQQCSGSVFAGDDTASEEEVVVAAEEEEPDCD
ncbi:MAG: hypothetical protein OEN20_09390 [Gammaproteobacteria bacterium]|nr:hypothetical protein [Gammaproteobacteria bacterium]